MLLLVNLLLLRFCSGLLLTFESELHAILAAARPALVLVCETVSQSYGGLGMRITKAGCGLPIQLLDCKLTAVIWRLYRWTLSQLNYTKQTPGRRKMFASMIAAALG